MGSAEVKSSPRLGGSDPSRKAKGGNRPDGREVEDPSGELIKKSHRRNGHVLAL
jgi:hypothetical protein